MIASVNPPGDEQPDAGSAQWWRARLRGDHQRGRRPRAGGMTLDRITEATLHIIETEGLDAVTMRRVAADLGTGPASLYRHIVSRDELLVVVADELLAQLPDRDMDPTSGWRARSESIARDFRAALLASPALLSLVSRSQLLGPASLRARERALSGLVTAGFPPSLAVRTYLSLTHYVIGSVQLDDRSTKRTASDRAALQTLFDELDAETYPTVQAVADHLGGLHPDDEFDFGLTALLDGIQAALDRSP